MLHSIVPLLTNPCSTPLPLPSLTHAPPTNSAGAHPAIEDAQHWLPLHYACQGGHYKCAKTILDHPQGKGLTRLSLAISLALDKEKTDIVTILKPAQHKSVLLYTLIVLQRNRQWNKSDVPLTVGKVTAHQCNKRIVALQTPNANVCTGSSEWYKRIVPLMGGHHEY